MARVRSSREFSFQPCELAGEGDGVCPADRAPFPKDEAVGNRNRGFEIKPAESVVIRYNLKQPRPLELRAGNQRVVCPAKVVGAIQPGSKRAG